MCVRLSEQISANSKSPSDVKRQETLAVWVDRRAGGHVIRLTCKCMAGFVGSRAIKL